LFKINGDFIQAGGFDPGFFMSERSNKKNDLQ